MTASGFSAFLITEETSFRPHNSFPALSPLTNTHIYTRQYTPNHPSHLPTALFTLGPSSLVTPWRPCPYFARQCFRHLFSRRCRTLSWDCRTPFCRVTLRYLVYCESFKHPLGIWVRLHGVGLGSTVFTPQWFRELATSVRTVTRILYYLRKVDLAR